MLSSVSQQNCHMYSLLVIMVKLVVKVSSGVVTFDVTWHFPHCHSRPLAIITIPCLSFSSRHDISLSIIKAHQSHQKGCQCHHESSCKAAIKFLPWPSQDCCWDHQVYQKSSLRLVRVIKMLSLRVIGVVKRSWKVVLKVRKLEKSSGVISSSSFKRILHGGILCIAVQPSLWPRSGPALMPDILLIHKIDLTIKLS